VEGQGESIFEKDFFEFLNKRKGLLDGVCITGGEPLLHPYEDIASFIKKIKELGFSVKLDTNGSFPKKLENLIESGYVDYVAMDIKNSPSLYSVTAGHDIDMENIRKSVSLLMRGNVDFEFRTTVVQSFHSKESIEEIGKWIRGQEKYYLQMFVPSEHTIKQGLLPYSESELEKLRQVILPYVPNTFLRGV
jgi:pyruvate formate lyase activating enzyme